MSSFEPGSPVRKLADPSHVGIVVDSDGSDPVRDGFVFVLWEGEDSSSEISAAELIAADATPPPAPESPSLPSGCRYSIERLLELAELLNIVAPQPPGFVDQITRVPPGNVAVINDIGDKLTAALSGQAFEGDGDDDRGMDADAGQVIYITIYEVLNEVRPYPMIFTFHRTALLY